MMILRWNGVFCLTLPFFPQCYKPQYNSFKIVFDLLLFEAIDPYYRHGIKTSIKKERVHPLNSKKLKKCILKAHSH